MATTITIPTIGPRAGWLAVATAATALLIATAAPALSPRPSPLAADPTKPDHTISVSGTGRVILAPDVRCQKIGGDDPAQVLEIGEMPADGRQGRGDDGLVQRREKRRQHQAEKNGANLGVAHRTARRCRDGRRGGLLGSTALRPAPAPDAPSHAGARSRRHSRNIHRRKQFSIIMLPQHRPAGGRFQRPPVRGSYERTPSFWDGVGRLDHRDLARRPAQRPLLDHRDGDQPERKQARGGGEDHAE